MIEVNNLELPELAVYARLSERELLTCFEPLAGMFVAESPKVIARALAAGYAPVSALVEKRLLYGETKELIDAITARDPAFPVYAAEEAVFHQLTGFQLTRGILCAMRRRPLPGISELCGGLHRIAVLEHVMNPTNVGAIFRSAAAMRMEAVVLTRGSADPLYRRAARVSMGTVFQIPWTFAGKEEDWHGTLKRLGFSTCAMALTPGARRIDDPALKHLERLAVVLGTEGDGLSPSTIAACDEQVIIPMTEGIDSLNVAAASAVAFWELGKSLQHLRGTHTADR